MSNTQPADRRHGHLNADGHYLWHDAPLKGDDAAYQEGAARFREQQRRDVPAPPDDLEAARSSIGWMIGCLIVIVVLGVAIWSST